MNKSKKLIVALAISCTAAVSIASSALAVAGHANVAAVGTASSNSFYGVSYQSTYSYGQTHTQIGVLKSNLKTWRSYNESYFTGIPKITSTDNYFDTATRDNLKKFQSLKGLTADGIYGAASRNAMHASLGFSPKGYVRVGNTSIYTNYNDTASGLAGDSTYKLDHSYVTSSTLTTLGQIAQGFYNTYYKKLEINDASLIDGADTPEHSTHMDGKTVDIRNAGMTAAQEKKVIELAVANSNVKQVIFYTTHGVVSSKILVRADHADHFHLGMTN
ncbi:peptidoglycan-binding protein [Paenibacillus sp. YYML68]|uniref:peptidoglycan-binding domain-containing protein n=1 Tax=Paenibacillus sp. YYML68 TaxID=2909250 RepID=UPI0024912812|nr:peptidoglycan-binding protein [Paenibacillus sp. YYML68]